MLAGDSPATVVEEAVRGAGITNQFASIAELFIHLGVTAYRVEAYGRIGFTVKNDRWW